jgi:DtxR family Mn-dependent transcriptional regulator
MTSPLMTLFTSIISTVILGAIFWPKLGITTRRLRRKKDKRRILVEDCLKFFHDCEYRKMPCRRQDIIEMFSLSTGEADTLLSSLQSAGMIRMEKDHLLLTESGRADALQIVRIHRLLERYLAEETSFQEAEWHAAAEDREHTISAREADEMAAQLGNPVYDPHGDPIPTAGGEMPGLRGISLSGLTVGESAKVVHIEDEPPDFYSRIVDLGFQLGAQISYLGQTEGGMRLTLNGVEKEISLPLANNITVSPLEAGEKVHRPFTLLSQLKLGESGKVIGISKSCRGQQRRRLMDLGVVPGSIITAEMKSVGGDPTAYLIRGALIALRKLQSDHIYIEDDARK